MFFNIRNQNSRKQVCSDDFAVRFAFLLPAIALAVIIFLFSAQPSDDSTETSQFVTRLILNIYDAAKGEKPAYAELMRLVAVYGSSQSMSRSSGNAHISPNMPSSVFFLHLGLHTMESAADAVSLFQFSSPAATLCPMRFISSSYPAARFS